MAASTYPLHGGSGQMQAGATDNPTTVVGQFEDFFIDEEVEIHKTKFCRATSTSIYTDKIVDRSCRFSALLKRGDAGQTLLLPGDTLYLRFQVDNNGAGADQANCQVIVQRLGTSMPMGDWYKIEVAASLISAVTWNTVSA